MPLSGLQTFFQAQTLVWAPMLAGYAARRIGISPRLARPIYYYNLLLVVPPNICMGIWKLEAPGGEWFVVPAIYALLMLAATAAAVPLARRVCPDPRQAGTFALLIPMSNIGAALGGALTLLLLPVEAFPYATLLLAPWIIAVFLIWIPLGRHMAPGHSPGFARQVLRAMNSGFILPLLAIAAGGGLNAGGVTMPDWAVALLKPMAFTSTCLVMFGMGLQFSWRRVFGSQRVLAWVYAAKFFATPLAALALCWVFGLHGLPAAALFIGAFMPVGAYVAALANLCDLDVHLANAGYFWTTLAFMTAGLPLMLWLLKLPIFAAAGH